MHILEKSRYIRMLVTGKLKFHHGTLEFYQYYMIIISKIFEVSYKKSRGCQKNLLKKKKSSGIINDIRKQNKEI